MSTQRREDLYRERRRNIYTALEDYDFIWNEDDLQGIRELWRDGIHLKDMARYYKRNEIEMFLILVDQAAKGWLGARQGGVYGFEGAPEGYDTGESAIRQ